MTTTDAPTLFDEAPSTEEIVSDARRQIDATHAVIATIATIEAAIAERDALRRALADALTNLEANTIPTGDRIRAWRELAGTEYVDGLSPQERADQGTARAAAKWTDEEVAQVDAAIRTIVDRLREKQRATIERTRAANYIVSDDAFPQTFTTADVWAELGDGFPITKGIAGRMTAAKGAGLIASTGRTTYPEGARSRVNHNQRLTVWRAL